jgi:hypothetical protein
VYSGEHGLKPALRADAVPPNPRLQLTPLRGPEIGAFLKTDFGSTVISIYRCGATEAQPVRRLTHASRFIPFAALMAVL